MRAMKFPGTVAKLGVLSVFLVGCASGGVDSTQTDIGDDDPQLPDPNVDDDDDDQGGGGGGSGGGGGGGSGCVTTTTSLLSNGDFDSAPMGMGWTETPIDPAYPLITDDQTIAESAPNMAWLGGIAQANAYDEMYQEVTVPAGTTSLRLTGYYSVTSDEFPLLAFDFGQIWLETASGDEVALDLDNTSLAFDWTDISFDFAAPHAGETVRLYLATDSDEDAVTNFFFDSLDLIATSCQ